jgi:hypothetical protein
MLKALFIINFLIPIQLIVCDITFLLVWPIFGYFYKEYNLSLFISYNFIIYFISFVNKLYKVNITFIFQFISVEFVMYLDYILSIITQDKLLITLSGVFLIGLTIISNYLIIMLLFKNIKKLSKNYVKKKKQ